jgi:hypothetical protein
MSSNFYIQKPEFPLNLKSAIETYLQYICKRLYPNEIPKDRLVLSNIGNAGSEGSSRFAIQYFQNSNLKYPFTAYSIGELEQDDTRINHFVKSGNYYDSLLDCNISVIPSRIEISLISFFSNAFDYNRARTILLFDFASLTRLYYPLRVNGRIIVSVINVSMEEVIKGSYAYELEEALRQGRIFDIVHNVKLEFNEIVLNTERDGTPIKLYPVESLDLSIVDFETGIFIEGENYIIPKVVSSNIINNQRIDRNAIDTIEFEFNTGFLQGIIPEIQTTPNIEYDYEFDNENKKLILNLLTPLFENQTYSIAIVPNIVSDKGMIMQSKYELNFSTR